MIFSKAHTHENKEHKKMRSAAFCPNSKLELENKHGCMSIVI